MSTDSKPADNVAVVNLLAPARLIVGLAGFIFVVSALRRQLRSRRDLA